MRPFFYLKTLSFLAFVTFMFHSCRCSCNCETAPGCKTLIARDINTGDTIMVKKFCSDKSVYRDWAIQDSVSKFYGQYSNLTSFVQNVDSVPSHYKVDNLKCDETDFYAKQNFNCECAK